MTSCARRLAGADSFGKALSFASGSYVSVPSAVWFSGSFTLESWIYVRSFPSWSRLFDFGTGTGLNNVLFAYTSGTSGIPTVEIYNSAVVSCNKVAPASSLQLNTWSHLAATFDNANLLWTVYLNGVSVSSGASTCSPTVITRNLNYIGKSNWADGYADALYDDMRIWSVARTAAQILDRLACFCTNARCIVEFVCATRQLHAHADGHGIGSRSVL